MQLIQELRGNQRLRIGLALIAALLALYGLLEWRDLAEAQKGSYKQLASQALRLSREKEQAQWPDRALQARQAQEVADAQLWRQTSLPLAQAQLQDWLYAALRQADAKNYAVKLADASAKLGVAVAADEESQSQNLTAMRARLSFGADAPVLLALLSTFAEAEHPVVVEALSLKAQRVEMTVAAWYAGAPAAAAPVATAISAPSTAH